MSVSCEKRGRVDYIDQYVGDRLKARRVLLGLSQEIIGNALHISIQQVQKYEKGVNRISSGNLYRIGHALNVPIAYFFEEVDINCPYNNALAEVNEKDVFTLIKAYNSIGCEKAKQKIAELVTILSICKDKGEDRKSNK